MNGIVSLQFNRMVPHGKLEECIEFLESGLRAIQPTPYHCVLGKTFLAQTENMAEWLSDFCRQGASEGLSFATVYLEMNAFTINPNQWHCNLFGYKVAGTIWKRDWLSKWDIEPKERFVLQGMEPVQRAFADLFLDTSQPLGVKLAEEVSKHLVTARFMQLVASAHEAVKSRFEALVGLPVLASAHDWNTVHQTK